MTGSREDGPGLGGQRLLEGEEAVSSCTQGAGTLDFFHRQTVLKAVPPSQITTTEQTPR